MVGIFGTMAATCCTSFGVPYIASTVLFAVALGAVFWAWHRSEGTLSIHSITTARRERLLLGRRGRDVRQGTVGRRLAAHQRRPRLLLVGIVFGRRHRWCRAVGYRWFSLNGVVAFWLAYVLTRPLRCVVRRLGRQARCLGGLAVGSGS